MLKRTLTTKYFGFEFLFVPRSVYAVTARLVNFNLLVMYSTFVPKTCVEAGLMKQRNTPDGFNDFAAVLYSAMIGEI